jgi:pyruvate dehydrogenase E2 component (dihydrolipoamide acetyltransferase)
MATLLRVPEVATGATQALLTEWLVAENTRFAAGDPIVVLETDKAAVEVEAEVDAVLLRTLVPGGTTVAVGVPIALLGQEAEAGHVDKLLSDLGIGTFETSVADDPVAEPASGRIFSSPLARKLLKEAGLAPRQVRGTGPGGRIIRRDADQAIAAAQSAIPAGPPVPVENKTKTQPGTAFEEIPHTRLRLAVAKRLTESKRDIPHFYVRRTARIDALLALREQLNAVSAQKISVNDLVIRAVACAHVQVPDANVIWTDENIRKFGTVDVAVAIAGKRGLVTPVLRGVEKATLSTISQQVRQFVLQAGEGRLRQRDLEGGTITVSNLGMYGVEEFSAIIDPPQSAILAVGAGRPAPAAADGEVRVETQMALTLSVDHRAIDGALAAHWMAALVQALEQPLRLVV